MKGRLIRVIVLSVMLILAGCGQSENSADKAETGAAAEASEDTSAKDTIEENTEESTEEAEVSENGSADSSSKVHSNDGASAFEAGPLSNNSAAFAADDTGDEPDTRVITKPSEEEILSALAATDLSLQEHYGDDHSIMYDDEEGLLTVDVWMDGITGGVIAVQKGMLPESDWDEFVEGMRPLADALYDRYKPYGIDVSLNVLNDKNKDYVLLSFLNGEIVVDAIRDEKQ